jgi:hypothetical protein
LIVGTALSAVSTAALAHGEEVLLTIALQAVSFIGCAIAIGISKHLKPHRPAAAAGTLLGLATIVWPLGAIPYTANTTLINVSVLLACPAFMLCAYAVAAWWQRHPR